MPEKGRVKGKWRNFLGKKYTCPNDKAKFVLKERHKDLIEEATIREGQPDSFKALFVHCPDCNYLIPLNPDTART